MGQSDGWIGVDLDGTLAVYQGWKGVEHIGAPIWPMVERVKTWLSEGRKVKIMTARVGPVKGRDDALVRAVINSWCMENIGRVLPITCIKDFAMIELWDDRAVQVDFNRGEPTQYWSSRVADA